MSPSITIPSAMGRQGAPNLNGRIPLKTRIFIYLCVPVYCAGTVMSMLHIATMSVEWGGGRGEVGS